MIPCWTTAATLLQRALQRLDVSPSNAVAPKIVERLAPPSAQLCAHLQAVRAHFVGGAEAAVEPREGDDRVLGVVEAACIESLDVQSAMCGPVKSVESWQRGLLFEGLKPFVVELSKSAADPHESLELGWSEGSADFQELS